MRKLFAMMLGLCVASAWALAQEHPVQPEKLIKATITFSEDTRVGTDVLKAGEYKVICDGKTVTFTREDNSKKTLNVACKGRHLPKAADQTTLQTRVDASGMTVLDVMFLKGSNIEHTFK